MGALREPTRRGRRTGGWTNARSSRARSLFALSVACCAALLAACGDDDGEAAGQTLAITATGGGSDFAFEVDSSQLEAGAVEITFVNDSRKETDAQLVTTSESHSEDEVVAELRSAMEGEPVAEWFAAGGGPGATKPGMTSTVTQSLAPGMYYVVGGGDPPTGPLASFEVTGDGGGELDEADATVEAVDYEFNAEPLPVGPAKLLLENNGNQWHHFLAARLVDGATIEDAQRFFETEKGPVPFEQGADQSGEIQSAVLEGGTSQLVDVDLSPGKYAFYCFVSDKQGGPPHIAQGMLSEVEVRE